MRKIALKISKKKLFFIAPILLLMVLLSGCVSFTDDNPTGVQYVRANVSFPFVLTGQTVFNQDTPPDGFAYFWLAIQIPNLIDTTGSAPTLEVGGTIEALQRATPPNVFYTPATAATGYHWVTFKSIPIPEAKFPKAINYPTSLNLNYRYLGLQGNYQEVYNFSYQFGFQLYGMSSNTVSSLNSLIPNISKTVYSRGYFDSNILAMRLTPESTTYLGPNWPGIINGNSKGYCIKDVYTKIRDFTDPNAPVCLGTGTLKGSYAWSSTEKYLIDSSFSLGGNGIGTWTRSVPKNMFSSKQHGHIFSVYSRGKSVDGYNELFEDNPGRTGFIFVPNPNGNAGDENARHEVKVNEWMASKTHYFIWDNIPPYGNFSILVNKATADSPDYLAGTATRYPSVKIDTTGISDDQVSYSSSDHETFFSTKVATTEKVAASLFWVSNDNINYVSPAADNIWPLDGFDGVKTVYVKANDKAGNSTVFTQTVTYDSNAPSSPINLTATQDASNVILSWTNPSDLTGVTGAYVKIDNEPYSHNALSGGGTGSVSKSKYSFGGDGTHEVWVYLEDAAGNSADKNIIIVKVYIDSKNPTIKVITPPDNISNSIYPFSAITGIATDEAKDGYASGLKTVKTAVARSTDNEHWFFYNFTSQAFSPEALPVTVDEPAEIAYWKKPALKGGLDRNGNWYIPGMPDPSLWPDQGNYYKVVAFSYDNAGNVSARFTAKGKINKNPPTSAVKVFQPDTTTKESFAVTWESTSNPDSYTIRVKQLDGYGHIVRDWYDWRPNTTLRSDVFTAPDEGKYLFLSIAKTGVLVETDYNTDTGDASIFYDKTSPTGEVLINGGAATVPVGTDDVTLTLYATDEINGKMGSGVVKMKIWGAVNSTSSSDNGFIAYSSVPDNRTLLDSDTPGNRTVHVQYKDKAGNTCEAVATVEVTAAATTISNVDITRLGTSKGSSVKVTWVASGAVDLYYRDNTFSADPLDWHPLKTNDTSDHWTDPSGSHNISVGDGNNSFYKVVPAGHTLEAADLTREVVGKFDLDIREGSNNLISIPLITKTTAIADVIGNQLYSGTNLSDCDKISYTYYDPSTQSTKTNTSYLIGNSWSGSFTVEPDKGYYITHQTGTTQRYVTVVGKLFLGKNRPINLYQGSNMVGTVFPVKIPLNDANLKPVLTPGTVMSCDTVMTYDYTIPNWVKAYLILDANNLPQFTGTVTDFEPGKGYFINNQSAPINPDIWNYPIP